MNGNQKFSSLVELAMVHIVPFFFVVLVMELKAHTCCTNALHRDTLPALSYHILPSVATYV